MSTPEGSLPPSNVYRLASPLYAILGKRSAKIGVDSSITGESSALHVLTSLRFLAASLVFVNHAIPLANAFSCGFAGVTFFYLLSGFILTNVYYRDFETMTSLKKVLRFYIARIARVYPIHFVSIALTLTVLIPFADHIPSGQFWINESEATRRSEIVAQLALVQSWFLDNRIHFGVNSPSWSISCEMFFYACFPFIVPLLVRALQGCSEKVVLMLVMLGTLLPAAVLFRVHVHPWWIYVFPPVRLIDFMLGMLMGIAFLRRSDAWPRLLRSSSVEFLVLVLPLFCIAWSPFVPESLRFSALFSPCFAIAIYAFAHQRGVISRVLSSSVFVRLGEASFAFYLTHATVIAWVDVALPRLQPFERLALCFAIALIVGIALCRFVEQPLRARIKEAYDDAVRSRNGGRSPVVRQRSSSP